jgi:peptidyl-tRNA hydrolase, PTH1 family
MALDTWLDTWLVVGLGNPGPAYAGNRHNVGHLVVERLARRMGGALRAHRTRADLLDGRLGPPPGHRVVLARPRSYMNESGGPVKGLSDYFDVPVEQLVVVHDELDLPYGAMRVKLGGGDNGHNGLRSVRKALGTGEFYRVRVGVGRPPGRRDPADYLLSDFSPAERKELDGYVERAADAVESLICDGLERTQNLYNS